MPIRRIFISTCVRRSKAPGPGSYMDPSTDINSRPCSTVLKNVVAARTLFRHKRLPRFGFGTDTRLVKLTPGPKPGPGQTSRQNAEKSVARSSQGTRRRARDPMRLELDTSCIDHDPHVATIATRNSNQLTTVYAVRCEQFSELDGEVLASAGSMEKISFAGQFRLRPPPRSYLSVIGDIKRWTLDS